MQKQRRIVNKLSVEKYAEGADITLSNAMDHFKVSNVIAKTSYGIAISHLVVSLEELSKASVLKVKSIKPDLDISNLHLYFKKHTLKHDSIRKHHVASSLFFFHQEMEKHDDIIEAKPLIESKESNDIEFWVLLIIGFAVLAIVSKFAPEKEPCVIDDNSLEDLRKKGFYVDFIEQGKLWQSPGTLFKEPDYLKFKKRVENIFSVLLTSLFSDTINSKNILDYIETLEDENIITEDIEEYKDKLK